MDGVASVSLQDLMSLPKGNHDFHVSVQIQKQHAREWTKRIGPPTASGLPRNLFLQPARVKNLEVTWTNALAQRFQAFFIACLCCSCSIQIYVLTRVPCLKEFLFETNQWSMSRQMPVLLGWDRGYVEGILAVVDNSLPLPKTDGVPENRLCRSTKPQKQQLQGGCRCPVASSR